VTYIQHLGRMRSLWMVNSSIITTESLARDEDVLTVVPEK